MAVQPGDMQKFLRPMPEEDGINQWIDATDEERSRVFLGLLGLISAIGHYPPKEDLPVVFPPGWQQRAVQ